MRSKNFNNTVLTSSLSSGAGAVVWISGLSGAGKTTICRSLWSRLKRNLPELLILDGDEARSLFENGIVGNPIGHDEAAREKASCAA